MSDSEARRREAMPQVLVRMPREMHEAIKRLAASQDRAMAAEIRRAVRKHLADEGAAP